MRTIAFIFARGGSKGLKNKNILKINNIPLIAHSIILAKSIQKIDDVYVSTDSELISKISKNFGAKVIKRPKYLAKDKSSEILSWQHAIKFLLKKNIFFNVFISLPATSPLRKKADVLKCIKLLDNKTDLVITFQKTSRSPWFNMVNRINSNSDNLKLVIENKSKKIYRRQDAPLIYDMTTVCYVSRPAFIINNNYLFNGNIRGVEIPKNRAIDIDDKYDYEIAKFLLEK